MKFLSFLREHKVAAAIASVCALAPAYSLRFRIGPLPTTALEIAILAAILALIIEIGCHPRENGGPEIKNRSLFYRFLDSRFRGNDKLLVIGSGLVLIATFASIIVAPDHRAALGVARAFFWEPMLLAWLIIASGPSREEARRGLMIGLAVSASIVLLWAFIQYLYPSLIPAPWDAERRVTGAFPFPNALALYVAPLVTLFLSSPWGLALSICALAGIMLAKSAGGLGAVFASLFFLGLSFKKTRWATAAGAAIVAIAFFSLPQFSGLRSQALLQDWSGRVHKIGWQESWAMLKDHPVWGAGLSGFPSAVAPYHHARGVEIFQYPHNIVLATWSELGLFGLAGFALVIAWFFRRACAQRETPHPTLSPFGARERIFLAAAMIAIVAHGLVDVPYFKNDLALIFWLFVAIMALYRE